MKSVTALSLALGAASAAPFGTLGASISSALSSLQPAAFIYPAPPSGCATYTDNFDVAYYNTGIVPVAFSQVTNTTYNGTLYYQSFDYVPAYDGGFKAPTGPNVIGAPMLTAMINNGSAPSIYPKPTVKQNAFALKSLKYACTQGAGLTAIAYPAFCGIEFTGTKKDGSAAVTHTVVYNPNGSPKAFQFLEADFPANFTGLAKVDMKLVGSYTGPLVTVPLIDQVVYDACVQ